MRHSLMLHFQIKGDLERGGGMPADKKWPVLNEVVTFFPMARADTDKGFVKTFIILALVFRESN